MEVSTRQRFSYIVTEDGKRHRVEDIPEVLGSFIQKITNKRWNLVESQIKDVVEKERRLFSFLAYYATDVDHEPEPFVEQGIVWHKLSKKWIKQKKHDNFWYGKRDSKQGYVHLKDWFRSLIDKEGEIFGEPIINVARNLGARGWQRATVTIQPYPKKLADKYNSQTKKIYGTLKNGSNNEKERPLIGPAMTHIINNRIERKVTNILKEVMENG